MPAAGLICYEMRNITGGRMKRKKLTDAEACRLAEAFVAQALAMGLKGNQTLPKDIKRQVRERVLHAIEEERQAKAAQTARRQTYEAAENTFSWKPQRRR